MRLVVFDVDGTLVDSQDVIVQAMDRAWQAHGREAPSRSRVLSIVGLSLAEAFRALAPPDEPDFPIASYVDAYKGAFHALRASPDLHEPMFPGALETLHALARRDDVTLGIATGKSRRGVAAVLERHGLQGFFTTIQTADDAPSKPHPAMLLQAASETGIAADAAVMIGDTSFDMAMARAAGMGAIGVAWGYHPVEDLVTAGAQTIVKDFGTLSAMLLGEVVTSYPSH